MGSNLAGRGHFVSAPQIRGLNESASSIGQSKSPTKVVLAPGEAPEPISWEAPTLLSWCYCWRNVHVPVSLREAAPEIQQKQCTFLFSK